MPEHSRQWLNEIGMTDDLLASRVARAHGPVTPKSLPQDVRSDFESRSGYSADSVRVVESELPDAVAAGAVTQGNTIHFPRGGYSPSSGEGRRMLMHELGHTVQQAEGHVRANRGGIINDSPALEQGADNAFSSSSFGGQGASVASASLSAMPSGGAGAPLQLDPPTGARRNVFSRIFRRNRSSQQPSTPPAPNPPAPAPAPAPARTPTKEEAYEAQRMQAAGLTEEQLQQGMGIWERHNRRSELRHRDRKAEKKEFYRKIREVEARNPMPVEEDAHALQEILDINPDEPNIQPEEKKNRIKLQMEKIRFLQEKREQWQREHLQKVYAEVQASGISEDAGRSLRNRIQKAIRHNQKKELKRVLKNSGYVQMMQEYDGKVYNPNARAFNARSAPGGGAGGASTQGGVALPGMAAPRAGGNATNVRDMSVDQLAAIATPGAEDPGWKTALETGEDGFGYVDELSGAFYDSVEDAGELRAAYTLTEAQRQIRTEKMDAGNGDPFASKFEKGVSGSAGTGLNHALQLVGIATDAHSAYKNSKEASEARKMGDTTEAVRKGAEAAGNVASIGGRFNGFFSSSPDPVSCAFGLLNNATGMVSSGAGVHGGRSIRKAMTEQIQQGYSQGYSDSDKEKVKGYQARQLARRQGHRQEVSSGFDMAKNLVGMGGNVAGLFVGPGTIIKVAATGLSLIGTLAQKITEGAMKKHGEHAMADEVLGTKEQLEAFSRSGAWGLSQRDMRKALAKASGVNNVEELTNRVAAMRAAELHSRIRRQNIANPNAGQRGSAARARNRAVTAVNIVSAEDKALLNGLGFTDESKFHNITVDALYAKMGGQGSWQQALMGTRLIHKVQEAKLLKQRGDRIAQIGQARQQRANQGGNPGGNQGGNQGGTQP